LVGVWQEQSERAFAAVSVEIDGERASAFGRAGRAVQAAYERCRAIGEELDASRSDPDLLAAYRVARVELEQMRWRYQVQREAIGLLDQHLIDRHFPMPPRR
jgi:hypothetical protein